MGPTETITVEFENDFHHAMHKLLMEYFFSFKVDAKTLRVGRSYAVVHRGRAIHVELKEDGEDDDHLPCTYYLEMDGDIQIDKHYSKAEYQWMTAKDKLGTKQQQELSYAARELHIVFKIRPLYMLAGQIEKGID